VDEDRRHDEHWHGDEEQPRERDDSHREHQTAKGSNTRATIATKPVVVRS